jgi:hypothetical protein
MATFYLNDTVHQVPPTWVTFNNVLDIIEQNDLAVWQNPLNLNGYSLGYAWIYYPEHVGKKLCDCMNKSLLFLKKDKPKKRAEVNANEVNLDANDMAWMRDLADILDNAPQPPRPAVATPAPIAAAQAAQQVDFLREKKAHAEGYFLLSDSKLKMWDLITKTRWGETNELIIPLTKLERFIGKTPAMVRMQSNAYKYANFWRKIGAKEGDENQMRIPVNPLFSEPLPLP